jgi:hypothetical protein
MNTEALSAALATMRRTFSEDEREGLVCTYVFSRLEQLENQFDRVTLESVATALEWLNDTEGQRAIARALDGLAYGEVQILERKYEFWSENNLEVLDQPICEFSDEEIRNALSEKFLIVGGEKILDFLDRVTVSYIVTEHAHQLATSKGSKK